MIAPTVEIHEAIARATAGAHPDDRSSVEACAQALLMPLGVEGVHDRVRLRVTGARPDAVHELLVDERPVWRGARERGRWVSTWLVQPWSLAG